MQPSLFHGSCLTHTQYGLTCTGYEAFREDHQDRCRLCGQAKRNMNVDHDHQRGMSSVRGLLCARCNVAHMGRVDRGEYAIDFGTRNYLLTPWYLARRGEQLPYEPMVSVSIADLSDPDRTEVARLAGRIRVTGRSVPEFEHPGIAACLAHGDLRPIRRLLWLHVRGALTCDITRPEPNQRAFTKALEGASK